MKKDANGYLPIECRRCGQVDRPLVDKKKRTKGKDVLLCSCCGSTLAVVPRKQVKQNG